jgi:hypothetical protein
VRERGGGTGKAENYKKKQEMYVGEINGANDRGRKELEMEARRRRIERRKSERRKSEEQRREPASPSLTEEM